MGGQLGKNMFANSQNYNYYSESSKVSFDGFINENYFLIESQEKYLVQNIEISHAITKNPKNGLKDGFVGVILKSKFDGIGNRSPIDLSIALDVSGSMSSIDGKDTKNRLSLAKESLIKLISILDEKNDKMSLITFSDETKEIFGMINKKEIEEKYLNEINKIESFGETDLVLALKAAISKLDSNEKKEKRIIMITDAVYDDINDELEKLFEECVEKKEIPITIMAISSESNLILAEKLSKFKGCNYFSICKSSDLENYLVKNFNYIFFPIAYDTKIIVKSENTKFLRCFGGENDLIDEFDNKNEDFSPAPLNFNNEIIFNLGSTFSSNLLKIKDNLYSKGGLILLKLNYSDLNKDEDLKFNLILEYKTIDNEKSTQNYSYIINKNEKNDEYFKDNNMKKGISIYYFTSMLNHIIEIEKKRNEKNKEDNNDFKVKNRKILLLETKKNIIEYLNKNFVLDANYNESIENLNKYKILIDNNFTKTIS